MASRTGSARAFQAASEVTIRAPDGPILRISSPSPTLGGLSRTVCSGRRAAPGGSGRGAGGGALYSSNRIVVRSEGPSAASSASASQKPRGEAKPGRGRSDGAGVAGAPDAPGSQSGRWRGSCARSVARISGSAGSSAGPSAPRVGVGVASVIDPPSAPPARGARGADNGSPDQDRLLFVHLGSHPRRDPGLDRRVVEDLAGRRQRRAEVRREREHPEVRDLVVLRLLAGESVGEAGIDLGRAEAR